MTPARASDLAGLTWLIRDPASGAVEVRDGDGRTIPVTLTEGCERFFAADKPEAEVVPLRALGPDGAVIALEARRVPGFSDLGVAVVAGSRDRAVALLVETIVNQVAHDIRNFAFTIGLQAELGDRRAEAQLEVKGHLASVLLQVDALKVYLDRLLLYGRPVVLRPTAADVAAVVRQQVQAVQLGRRSDGPPLAITVDFEGDVGEARWDVRCVGHALQALIDNAVRSTEPPPPVVITVRREGARVTIEISDRGTGIPSDKIDEVWSPMRVRRHGGAGLGLAIAKKMITAHGGTVDLDTSARGTTVRLMLPVEVTAG